MNSVRSDSREERLPVVFFEKNRRKLAAMLPERAVAVIFAGTPKTLSADVEYPFFANRNFYYLTGVEQEFSVLTLAKDGESLVATLFLLPCDPEKERWTGKRLTTAAAAELSGITDIRLTAQAQDYWHELLEDSQRSFAYEEEDRAEAARKFGKLLLSQSREMDIVSLSPLLTELRMVKESCEIEAIKKAIHLTEEAVRGMAVSVKPGVSELELSAVFRYEMESRGCLQQAFPAIIAAGDHTLCLHHNTPSGYLQEGDLLQLDVGGRVAGLCADISRSFPVGGHFTEKQRILYNIVLACQRAAFDFIRPGVTIAEVNDKTCETAYTLLCEVGLLPGERSGQSGAEDIDDYYWHNVSHHMGHDVHDVAFREKPLSPGMVLTVEPGLYIPQWGFGIRIEDDVLVTQTGCEVLSVSFPREIDEMEAWVGESRTYAARNV